MGNLIILLRVALGLLVLAVGLLALSVLPYVLAGKQCHVACRRRGRARFRRCWDGPMLGRLEIRSSSVA
jgi:hypothetical protein